MSLTASRTREPAQDLPSELPPNAGRAAAGIAIVLVAQLMIVLDATVVNVALPRIDADLGFGPASLSWVLNAYTLAFGGLLLLGGRLGDVFGRLRLFQVGLAVFTVASALGGLAQTPGQLVVTRALQGVGAAMAAPSVLALLTTSAPDEAARNRAFALFGAVSSGGASIGLILGGLLTDVGSWRWTLFINVPLGLVVLALVGRYVAETPRHSGRFRPRRRRERHDRRGLHRVGAHRRPGARLELGTHHRRLRRRRGAAPPAGPHRDPAPAPDGAAAPRPEPASARRPGRHGPGHRRETCRCFFLVVQYVQRVLGYGPLASGFAFLPFSLGIFGMSRITPWLIGRVGPRAMLLAGTAALTVGYAWLSGADVDGSYLGSVFGPMLIAGLATGLVFMPITASVLGGVEPEHAGSASGLLQTTQQLGSAVGVAVIVSVYAAGAVPGQFVPGLQTAFLTSAGFTALALVVTATVLRTPRPRVEPALADAGVEAVAEAAA